VVELMAMDLMNAMDWMDPEVRAFCRG
jgi:hypothetical protein